MSRSRSRTARQLHRLADVRFRATTRLCSLSFTVRHNFIAGKAASPAKMQAFLGQERRDFFSNLLS